MVVRAGMQSTRFRPKPGEKVRTPRIVMLRYSVSITGETYDEPAPKKMSGHELLQLGIRIESRPGSALLRYEGVVVDAGHSSRRSTSLR